MKIALLLAVAVLFPHRIWAAASPAPISEQAWAHSLKSIAAAVQKSAPKLQKIAMRIDHSSSMSAYVTETSLGLRVDVDEFIGGPYRLSGDINSTANLNSRRDSRFGASIMGGGINVDIRPFGGTMYILSGIYTKENGKEGDILFNINAHFRDMDIRQDGIDLEIRWNPAGYDVDGVVDADRYNKKDLAILGGALAVLTHSDFWPGL